MTQPTRRTALQAAALAAVPAAWLPTAAQAQPAAFPARPVKLIVPFPAGGPVDATARVLAQRLAEAWGQQVLVDNRAGAGGMVGADAAAKSSGDGHTLLMSSIHHSVLPALKPNLPYNVERDLLPVSFAATFPIVLVVQSTTPVKNVAELIAWAKKEPGKLNFSSSGNGGGTHLAGELFNARAGVKILHVPYKGSAAAMTDLLAGQVQMMFSDMPSALPHIKSGRLRALGVGNPQRSAMLPEVPTIAEAGLAGYEAYSWTAVMAPAGTPPAIVAKVSADVGRALSAPEVKQRLLDLGAEAGPNTPEQFGAMLKAEIAKWAQVVKAANIQAD